MFRNIKLKTKIMGGFGIILAIYIVIWIPALINMKSLERQSAQLSQEYIPLVASLNDAEQNQLETMLDISSYALIEDKSYLNEGKAKLEEVKRYLNDLRDLSNKYPNLSDLKNSVETATTNISQYEKKLNETETKNNSITDAGIAFDNTSSNYMKACNDFLNDQYSEMQAEIKSGAGNAPLAKSLLRITLINDIINEGDHIGTGTFKSRALHEGTIAQDALGNFNIIERKLQELRPITDNSVNIRQIDEIEAATEDFKSKSAVLSSNWNSMVGYIQKKNETALEILKTLRDGASAGMKQTRI